MSNVDPALRDHQAWLGALQPEGLVVSAAALVAQQVFLDRATLSPLQERFRPFVAEVESDDRIIPALTDLRAFLLEFLGWPEEQVVGLDPDRPLPDELRVPLPDLGETLEPGFALRDPRAKADASPWLLLGQLHPLGTKLDEATAPDTAGWSASPARRFERLLRETRVPIGLLLTPTEIRLVSAPRGENAGSLTFPVAALLEVADRKILGALELLLGRHTLFVAPGEARLPALLEKSRDIQANVSTELAGQVLDALYELVRGFAAADEKTKGELLRKVLAENPDDVYRGLLTILLRLVFLLYAEDRGLLPGSSLYHQGYSAHGLFERLRADAEHFPDTMDRRYGAWAQLLALFRLVFDGHRHPDLKMPARRGHLFDPARFPFLEGGGGHLPLLSDATVFAVLRNLLILGGERLSYRTLDVEQIGSVYETMMGFRMGLASGPSIALKPKKKHGAPSVVDLARLLATKPADRAKLLDEEGDQKLSGKTLDAVKSASSLDDLLAALEKRIARSATPHVVPKGSMVLQPSDERRRSGSHYTPRSLTEPIVRKTLEPIFARLGENPTPDAILDLKLCDPAMGSGAFLVEACRQLSEKLVESWHRMSRLASAHPEREVGGGVEGRAEAPRWIPPVIPPDEDELLHARRLVAQRCLYGVDKNPMAVDLAKLSLWLATLAKDHPFTFLDHNLRAGDSLVGLTKDQIARFHWAEGKGKQFVGAQGLIAGRIRAATDYRKKILDAGDVVSPEEKRQQLAAADEALSLVRLAGDLAIAAFFGADKDKEREKKRDEHLDLLTKWMEKPDAEDRPGKIAAKLREGKFGVTPFHWEIEFPEVFGRETSGFDAMVGNPPFAGKNTIIASNHVEFPAWLKILHEESHGNADLVAHFFRRSFGLVSSVGVFGLIATNTIGQGDTRSTGLRWICAHGGVIFAATRRLKWPGEAAVVVSVVHVTKGSPAPPSALDGAQVPLISAYLFHGGGHENPATLRHNEGKCFQGTIVLGMGFTFDESSSRGAASPVAEMERLIAADPKNAERIWPYIGGEEVNDSPGHLHRRWVINFGDLDEEDARRWPDLIDIVEARVRPERAKLQSNAIARKRASCWWQFGSPAKELYAAISSRDRVLAFCRHQPNWGVTFLKARAIFAESLNVMPVSSFSAFSLLQSRPHEIWARFFGSSMKDDLRYTPSDCFETFPFPRNWEANPALEEAGRVYYEFRADLMVRNDEGLTKTYNRFHDRDHDGSGVAGRSPSDVVRDILRLRELHAAMDRAVLDAYGWSDIPTACEFILDYEDEDDDEEESGKKRRKKKPWRYRWPDEVRDEVLARLLALNAERAEEERLAGEAAGKGKKGAKGKGRGKNANAGAGGSSPTATLFDEE